MLKYTSVFYDLMMRSWPYTCVDQWPGFVHSVRKYTSVHFRTSPYRRRHNQLNYMYSSTLYASVYSRG
ncbi:hypothetical protein Hanom_Chr00s000001g01597421 [Helianthus anomalus]